MVTKKYFMSVLDCLEERIWFSFRKIREDINNLRVQTNHDTRVIATIMSDHEARFHAPKPAPKKPAKKSVKKSPGYDPKYSPERLNKLIETIRKA